MQICGICQKHIEQNRVTYRCGDMGTCSPECNVKRLEYLYIIDPNLSSPVKWEPNNTVPVWARQESRACREEVCCPEIYRPATFHKEYFTEEKVKRRRDMPSIKYCTLITFVPISILLYNTLFN